MASKDDNSSPCVDDQIELHRLATVRPESAERPAETLPSVGIPTHPAKKQLCLQDLPFDILCLILSHPQPSWRSNWAAIAFGPMSSAGSSGVAVSQKDLASLAQTSRTLYQVATPCLYHTIHMRDISSMLELWATLCDLRPQNASYIRHLVFDTKVFTDIAKEQDRVAKLQLVAAESTSSPPELPAASPNTSVEPFSESFIWADGQPLLRSHFSCTAPSFFQRIYFDIIGRSEHLQSFGMMPPSTTNINATFIFRQALATLTSPSLARPMQYLQNLRTITINVEGIHRDFLSNYGILVMPKLERLALIGPTAWWFLKIRVISEGIRKTTILQKVYALYIAPVPRLTSRSIRYADLALGLDKLPNLESLAIRPRVGLTFINSTVLHLINRQLQRYGGALRCLDLSWVFQQLSTAGKPPLDASCHLTCLSALQSLVSLTVSTQVLFGTLSRLQDGHHPPYNGQVSESYNLQQAVESFLESLPPNLQQLILIEHWCPTELGPHGETTHDHPMPTHGEGDSIEARLEDGNTLTGERDTAIGRAAIRAPHEIVIVELVGALCSVWLREKPMMRSLVVQPQQADWYMSIAHPVILAEVDGLLCRNVGNVYALAMRYAFVEEIWTRGVEGCC